MEISRILPEGWYSPSSASPLPLSAIQTLMEEGTTLEAIATRCDAQHNLHVRFRGYEGLIPRAEAVSPFISGADREIAVLSRVGHCVQFVITSLTITGGGRPLLLLSRRRAQERALRFLLGRCPPGTVLRGKISRLERFGAFVDIGGGVIGLLPLEHISVARITHPAQRFTAGQKILCAIARAEKDTHRFTLTHKELLGTWLENAALFAPGETVTGRIRGIKDYGCFVELTPNLSGLADCCEDARENDPVTVFIKSIRPEQMKIKLQILQKTEGPLPPEPLHYYITDGCLLWWEYAPPGCEKPYPPTIFSPSP